MSATPIMRTPAESLAGKALPGGWLVGERLARAPYATGSCFSQGYHVTNTDGRKGFLKALDYFNALAQDDPATVLNAMTQAFLFEREICNVCVKRSMRKVVRAIDAGTVNVDASSQMGIVQYLIFELAEGDARKHIAAVAAFNTAGALRALHHVCTGLFQLHGSGIAHQDLKPSNMLVFDNQEWKVGDLGRACSKDLPAPHDRYDVAGDPAYAPPELLYHYVDPDWNRRRFGCDAYLLGSMILFLFTGAGATAQLLDQLDPSFHWSTYSGTYDEVLPYLRDAYGRALETAAEALPSEYRSPLLEMLTQLCDPDPRLRGHPQARGAQSSQYSLERYISLLNLLATRAEIELRKEF